MTTYRTPTDLPTVSFPLGVDSQIVELQSELSTNLSWLEYSFGRAFIGSTEQTKGKDYTYPMIYRGKGDYQDASPNDNLISSSFFLVDGDYDYDEYDINEPNRMSVPVSLIIWGNLKRLSPAYDEHFGGVLLQDLLRVLRENGEVEITKISDNATEVFKEFSIRQDSPSLFYYPYFCYRVYLNVFTQEECANNINLALGNYGVIDISKQLNSLDATLDFIL